MSNCLYCIKKNKSQSFSSDVKYAGGDTSSVRPPNEYGTENSTKK